MRLAALALLAAAVPLFGQYKMQTPAGEAPGPWLFGTIGVGKGPDGKPLTTALKGLAIKLGENGEAGIVYDLDLCRVAGAWTGGKFVTPMNLMSRGEYPTALGEVLFTTGEVPGFQIEPTPAGSGGVAPRIGGGVPTGGGSAPGTGGPLTPPGAPLKRSGATPDPAIGAPAAVGGTAPATGGAPGTRNSAPDGGNSAPAAVIGAPGAKGGGPFPPAAASGQQKEAPASPESGSDAWTDPRPEPFGPLPPGQARFKGLHLHGGKTVLKWDIDGVEVLEMPDWETRQQVSYLSRTFLVGPRTIPIDIAGCPNDMVDAGGGQGGGPGLMLDQDWLAQDPFKSDTRAATSAWRSFVFFSPFQDLAYIPSDSRLPRPDPATYTPIRMEWKAGQVYVRLWPSERPARFKMVVAAGLGEKTRERFRAAKQGYGLTPPVAKHPRTGSPRIVLPNALHATEDLQELLSPGPARWSDAVTTGATLSPDTASAYVVDTVKLPELNPWGAPMFISGFDLFDTGKGKPDTGKTTPAAALSGIRYPVSGFAAAVCTFHGDVFLLSDLEGDLGAVKWRRFASGLYHPLGLKIVDGEVFVTCRDGLYRLRDLNGDGEADFYEAFNYDVKVTKSFHEFVFDLQRDAAGNFYFAKAGPVKNGGRGFDEIMAHHGTLMRVSADGAKLDVVATGFRAPNGIGVGPHGELTSGDNEGTWTPACKINWIKPGGFYGVVPLAHRPEPPSDYDRPLCWLPKRVDNSGGSQVWVPDDDRWGPWRGQLLHLSYGKAALYGVLKEDTGYQIPDTGKTPESTPLSGIRSPLSRIVQGGVVKFPLKFESGIMRARFHPKDGSLWVAGLRGWQTDGLKNGCLQRVRYTDKLSRMPIELHAKKSGVTLRFTDSLDTQSAADPENWNVEVWNYVWSAAYGSPEISTLGAGEAPAENGKEFTRAQMTKTQHDTLKVRAVQVGTDDRSVTLDIDGLKPVMQMAIKYRIKGSDGAPIEGEVVNTIHALGD